MNGPIGKQMVDTLVESSANFEMILKFFDIFLKMKDMTSSEAFLVKFFYDLFSSITAMPCTCMCIYINTCRSSLVPVRGNLSFPGYTGHDACSHFSD